MTLHPRWALPALLCAAALAVPVAASASGAFVEPGVRVIAELHGDTPFSTFGWAISELRDVTGDGVQDFMVAEPFNGGDGATGSVKIYSGAGGTLVRRLDGLPGDVFGWSLADAGDTNGDGVTDIVVGAIFAGGTGRATLYSGRTGAVLHVFSGVHAGDRLGFSVASAGDVDKDGRADVLVGAPGSDASGRESGRAYLYSGRTFELLRKFDAGHAGDRLGTAIDGTGDVNGDGVPDAVVGARDAGRNAGGRTYVFSGANGRLLWQVDPPTPDAVDFGYFFVAGVGDTNLDGIPDVFAADVNDGSLGISGTGAAGVYSGRDGTLLHRWVGTAPNEGLGPGREAGDVNGDGAVDLAIGSWVDNTGAPQAGKVQIFSGLDGSLLRTITSTTAFEQFGYDAVDLGDVDGDGKRDLLVGAGGGSTAYVIAGK